MWIAEADVDFHEVFARIGESHFPTGKGRKHDEFVMCENPSCGVMWGCHGTGNFDAYIESAGWVVVGGQHFCPDCR